MKRVHLTFLIVPLAAFILYSCDEREETKQPQACFAVSNETVAIGETVIFTNCSTDAKTYKWDFKDGNTSVLENPTHEFNAEGTFRVKLEAWNNELADEVEKTITVTGGSNSPDACFSASTQNPSVNTSVVFTNCSTNANSYNWNFGDGGTSTTASPSHTYTSVGKFTVTLTASNGNLSDVSNMEITVTETAIHPEIWDGISYDYYTTTYGTDFSESGGWIEGTDAAYSYTISSGYYTMYRTGPGVSAISLNGFDYSGNYEIETSFKITGYSDTYNNGLIWGLDQNVTNWKFFNTSADGYYFIGQFVSEAYTKWVDWTSGANLSPYENLLTMRVYNNKFYMFLNKVLVYQGSSVYSDNGPYLGFFISTGSTIMADFFNVYDIEVTTKKSGSTNPITREMLRIKTSQPEKQLNRSASEIKR